MRSWHSPDKRRRSEHFIYEHTRQTFREPSEKVTTFEPFTLYIKYLEYCKSVQLYYLTIKAYRMYTCMSCLRTWSITKLFHTHNFILKNFVRWRKTEHIEFFFKSLFREVQVSSYAVVIHLFEHKSTSRNCWSVLVTCLFRGQLSSLSKRAVHQWINKGINLFLPHYPRIAETNAVDAW